MIPASATTAASYVFGRWPCLSDDAELDEDDDEASKIDELEQLELDRLELERLVELDELEATGRGGPFGIPSDVPELADDDEDESNDELELRLDEDLDEELDEELGMRSPWWSRR
jgi:hypothetical protein